MLRWNGESPLEIVEMLSGHEGLPITEEQELSDWFDDMLDENHKEGGKCPHDMTPTDIRCMFNDWKDGLMKDGTIHEEQCDQYCYEGKYGDDK